jgi:hypothetical protein
MPSEQFSAYDWLLRVQEDTDALKALLNGKRRGTAAEQERCIEDHLRLMQRRILFVRQRMDKVLKIASGESQRKGRQLLQTALSAAKERSHHSSIMKQPMHIYPLTECQIVAQSLRSVLKGLEESTLPFHLRNILLEAFPISE